MKAAEKEKSDRTGSRPSINVDGDRLPASERAVNPGGEKIKPSGERGPTYRVRLVESFPELADALGPTIAYHSRLVPLAGVAGAVMLSQALFWQSLVGTSKSRLKGWWYKTDAHWTRETGLTVKQLATAREKLGKAGVLKSKRAGVPARYHYQVQQEALLRRLTAIPSTPAYVSPSSAERRNKCCQKAELYTENSPENSDFKTIGQSPDGDLLGSASQSGIPVTVLPKRDRNQHLKAPHSVTEVLRLSLHEHGFNANQAAEILDCFDPERQTATEIIDSFAEEEYDMVMPTKESEALQAGFRFIRYNNLHHWPIRKSWRAAFKAWLENCKTGHDVAEVPKGWIASISYEIEDQNQ